ncbi:MAG: heparan-alpha-glucosaminide N-acetyltransferase domain-containing protein, partial [Microterricola sp.]
MTVPSPAPAGWVNGAPVSAQGLAQRGAGTGQIARLVGIDFARFLAIVGMMCAHLLLQPGMPGHQAWVSSLVDGNASTLFAVIGGISVILATRRYLEAGSYAAAAWAMAARGVLVIALGATLAMLPVSVVVVLVYFGVAMLCTIPFLRMPVRWLLVSAAFIALIGPFVTTSIRGSLDVTSEAGGLPWTELADPALAVRAVFVTGTYPVITWVVYLLVGMALARLLLAARGDEPAERRFIVRSGA